MKTRDEFIKSVREKSEIAMAEKEAARAEKKIKQKKIMRWSVAAAACLVIAVGAGSIGSMVNTGADGFMTEKYKADGADTAGTSDGAAMDNTASTAELGGQSMPTEPAKGIYDDAATDAEGTDMEESYGSVGKHLYMLPAGIVLEDLEECSELGITGDNIAKYMEWFYNLPDEMKLTAEEYEEEYEEECKKTEQVRTIRYRFTMDFSQGEDKEGVDRIFYILDGVELP